MSDLCFRHPTLPRFRGNRVLTPSSPHSLSGSPGTLIRILAAILLACTALGAAAQERGAAPPPQQKDSARETGKGKPAAAADREGSDEHGIADPKSYVIGPEDVIAVKVWREADLSGEHMVRPDGRISLPLVSDVEAAGQTPEQLAKAIAEGLSKYMNQPEVSVAVRAINSKFYFIQGEVLKPGKYPLLIPTTDLQALVNAGGFQEFANRKKIVVMRGEKRHKFNYKDVINGKNLDQNIELLNGDLIVVP
jgi:polysaccharide export outer membrane protein